MQYGPIPTNPFERLALMSGKVPVPLMDALFSIMKARGLMAAVRLGVFEELTSNPKTVQQIADARRLDPKSLNALLRCMVWAGYLQQSGDRFSLSKLSRRTMVKGAKMQMTGFLEWNYTQWKIVEGMEHLLQTGQGMDFHTTMTNPDEWRWYQQAMLEVARFDAPIVAGRVPVRKGARKLLDLAGSHGLIGVTICKKHPGMRSTVVDLPSAIEHARQLAKDEGIADWVDHRSGDIHTSDLGSNHDVAVLANILHHFLPDPNIALLKRVRDALSPDGTVAIWELETPDADSRPSEGDGAALFFQLSSTALCYSGKEYSRWLREAGFERVRAIRPALAPRNVLVVGRKPAHL